MAKEKGELTKALDEHTIKTMTMIKSLMKWDKIDLHDTSAVEKRCIDYFNLMLSNNKRPLVMGLAMALGIDRRRLHEITRGQITANKETHIPQASKDIICRAYGLLEVVWESLMVENKINSVTGIFLGKNNFGYTNEVEVHHATPKLLGEPMTEDERRALEQRILDSITK